MYLAQTDEYKQKFELFITYPNDIELVHKLHSLFYFLTRDFQCEHTSHSVQGKQGWAFFEILDSQDENNYPPEMEGEPGLHPEVKKFIRDKIMREIHHDIEYGPAHDRTVDRVLYEGIEIMENVEVDCFYFYDNVKWYE